MTRRRRHPAARAPRVAAGIVSALLLASCSSAPAHRAGRSATTAGRATTPGSSTTGSATTGTPAPTPATTAAAPGGPCGSVQPAAAHYLHVVWIWMENHGYGSVIGSPSAPFENQIAAQCGLATNYHNVTHPSLPNYIAATSGLGLGGLGRFSSDCDPSPSCSASPSAPSIFSQAASWRSYEESMPAPCTRGSSDDYAARHNPALYYPSVAPACSSDDVPIAGLYRDLAAGALPAFSFVTPNLIDDTHNGTVAQGDSWLRGVIRAIIAGAQYRSGTVAVFVVWDEGEGGSASDCATNTSDAGCHVPAIVLSASTRPGTTSAGLFNHYSLLRTAEDLLGLPALGQAASAPSMAAAFGLAG